MSIGIGSNIASLGAQRRLAEGRALRSHTFERLSSGLRINRASDDAAGLAIASSLSVDRRVFAQGIRNLNDGISLLNIADGAIQQLSTIVVRLKELAEQSANGAYGIQQRKSLDAEAQALSEEYFRIAQSTKFNGRNLFDQDFGILRLQSAYGTDGSIASELGGAIGTGSMGVAVSDVGESGASSALALGDLNGDGILDIVSAGYGGGTGLATVRLGLGNGSFADATSYTTETNSTSAVSLSDVNGDGILDLVTGGRATAGNGWATIRLGAGDGTFGSAVSYAMGSNRVFGMTLGDLNGDGILDLVTAGLSTGGNAMVRLGLGDGTFGEAVSYTTETGRSNDVALGDLNGDGILDLITAGRSSGLVGYATVRLGRGDGTFGGATSYVMEGRDSESLALGDLNGDGILDLATAGYFSSDGYATVRLGRGDGTFGSAVSYTTENGLSWAVTLGDLNGDGILDLVTAGRTDTPSTDGYATVRLGRSDGSFGSAISYATESAESFGVALGDLDGDGIPDLATAGDSDSSFGYVTIHLADTTSGIHPLLPFKLTSRADALHALSIFDNKIAQLDAQRGVIGGFQSRLSVATNVLQASSENYAAAAGRIQDADMAAEAASLIRAAILQQAAAAALAHASQQPALAIQLLQRGA